MKKVLLLTIFVLLSSVMLTGAQAGLPSLDDLESGWNEIPTDGVCSSGTSYKFLVSPGEESDNLLIFFDGGGACWFGQACDLRSLPNVHSPLVDESAEEFATAPGIFARDNPDNPFADYDMVFIPYCTGDVFIGAGEREYTYQNNDGEDVSVTVYHNGYENATTVLDWVYENFDSPERVLVAGSSAGAIGASFHAGFVAENYSDVDVTLMADAAGGYASPMLPTVFNAWDTAAILPEWDYYVDKTNDNLTFEDFYIASALQAENLRVSQYNAAYDETQVGFTLLLGDPADSFTLPQRILNNYLTIESAIGEFVTYTAGGDTHTILGSDRFYDFTVDGVRFVDWLADFVNGEPVSDVSCVSEIVGCLPAPGETAD